MVTKMLLGKRGKNKSSTGQGFLIVSFGLSLVLVGVLFLPTQLNNLLALSFVRTVVGLHNVIFQFDFDFSFILMIAIVLVCVSHRAWLMALWLCLRFPLQPLIK